MSDLVEKVARAIAKPENLECAWENFTDEARAAIAMVLRDHLEWLNKEELSGLYLINYAHENGVSLDD